MTATSAGPMRMPAWVWALLGAGAITVGAQLRIDVEPIPMTLQTLALMLLGFLGGTRHALLGAGLYLALVLAGVPVLSEVNRVPLAEFVDWSSAGYVVGFVPGAWLAGYLGAQARDWLWLFFSSVLAQTLIAGLGAAWLARFVGAELALDKGLWSLMPGLLVKAAAAATVVRLLARPRR